MFKYSPSNDAASSNESERERELTWRLLSVHESFVEQLKNVLKTRWHRSSSLYNVALMTIHSDSDSVYWTYCQKAKNQKAKQTIMHCTTKQYNTRQEMTAMQCNGEKW